MPISFTPAALRQWTKLDPAVRTRIRAKVEAFAASGTGDVKKLQGRGGSRLRIGDWRVIFYMEDATPVIAAVGHRREIYDYEEAMAVKFKKTDKGEIAILPRTEYEKLAARAAEAEEDEGTARIVARARKEVATGAPLIPLEVAERIANGENRLKVLREWRDVPQTYLSLKTNIGQGYISDLENGRRKGTVAALSAIAKVLNVPLDILVTD